MDYRNSRPPADEDWGLFESLKRLPKIDLHRHLEGSLRLGTLVDIARDYRLDLPGYTVDHIRRLVQMMPDDERKADIFISKFDTLRTFYRSPEIISRIAYEVVADAAADNIIYLELRFTPVALARQMAFSFAEVTSWVIDAVTRAEADFGIDVRLLVSMNRHESVELGERFVDIAVENMGRGVVGLDLAGAENRFPGAPFESVFRNARQAGLSITAHAAEWAGPQSAVEAVEKLGAVRLGHGVRVVEDPRVVAFLRDRGIAFEVCPTSNVQTGVCPSLADHPLRDMYDMGLLTTINTDDPSISGISLTDEYVGAVKYLGFTLGDLRQHLLNAARVAFISPLERERLINRVERAFRPPAARPAR